MKKTTSCDLPTSLVLFVIPTQLQAGTEKNPAVIHSTESSRNTNKFVEIKPYDPSAITSFENKETLKEARQAINDQYRHSRRYQRKHVGRNVDVVAGTQVRGDGYYERRHRHRGAYIGGGGILVLIIILILVL